MRVWRVCTLAVSSARGCERATSANVTRQSGKSEVKALSAVAILLLINAVAGTATPAAADETNAFLVTSIQRTANGSVTITWESGSDHAYLVASTSLLATNGAWIYQAAIAPGQNATTTWTDTAASSESIAARFYRVERLWLGDTVGDGIPDWWRQFYFGTDTVTNSESSVTSDPDTDGVNNLAEFLQGRDPTVAAVPDTDGLVKLTVFTALE